MAEVLTLRERMSDADKALYCRMLGRKLPDDLPDALFEAYFRVARLTNRIDALIRPGTMALIALNIGFNPDTMQFDCMEPSFEFTDEERHRKPEVDDSKLPAGEEPDTGKVILWPKDAYPKDKKVQFFSNGSVVAGKVETAEQTEAGVKYGIRVKKVKDLQIVQPEEIIKES